MNTVILSGAGAVGSPVSEVMVILGQSRGNDVTATSQHIHAGGQLFNAEF